MSINKAIVLLFVSACMLIAQNALAGADWQDKQKQMFSSISVKPGDIIDKSNWEKAKGLLPAPILNWLKDGKWAIKVAEFKYDFDYTKQWYDLSAKNKGKYGVGPNKELIELSTGKFPLYLTGMPFPDLDVENDPQGPVKLMHNNNLCLQMNASYDNIGDPKNGCLQWIGQQGYERGNGFLMQHFYYWNRPDGEQQNPNQYMRTTSLLATWPYDISGTATLYVRYLDGRDDSVYAYVPSIRRVKRLSGANRSDPQLGSDQCMDDSDGWNGNNSSMIWTYMGEATMLIPKWKGDLEGPRVMKKNDIGAWDAYREDCVRSAWEDKDPSWTGDPWAWTTATCGWAPREVWIIKATPTDPYYAYGTYEFYIDKLTRLPVYNMKYNRANEYWKMMANAHCMTQIPDPKYAPTANAFNMNGPMIVVDEKRHHASYTPLDETHMMADSPRVVARNHTPQTMKTWTK